MSLTDEDGAALAEAMPFSLQPVGAGLRYPREWPEGGALTGYGEQITAALTPAVEAVVARHVAAALNERAADVLAGAPVGNETFSARQVADYLMAHARLVRAAADTT